jgi:hypothetical protein
MVCGKQFDLRQVGARVATCGAFGIQHDYFATNRLTNFHGALEQCVHVRRPGAQPRHNLMVLSINIIVVLTQNVGVFHVGRRAFQAVQAQQAQTENVLANGGFVFVWREFCRLTLELTQIVAHQLQASHWVIHRGAGIHAQALLFQRFTHGDSLAGVAHNAR